MLILQEQLAPNIEQYKPGITGIVNFDISATNCKTINIILFNCHCNINLMDQITYVRAYV